MGVLGGYAIFRLLTLASTLYFAKYCVDKIHDLVKAWCNRPRIYEVKIGQKIIQAGEDSESAQELANSLNYVLASHSLGKASSSEVRQVIAHIRTYKPN